MYHYGDETYESGYIEMAFPDFVVSLQNSEEKLMNCLGLHIHSPTVLVYPPKNLMPVDPIYFEIPKRIEYIKKLKFIVMSGVFIIDIPIEITHLQDLEELVFNLSPKSDLQSIVSKLKAFKSLKSVNLSGSVLSKKDKNYLKRNLQDIRVTTELFE